MAITGVDPCHFLSSIYVKCVRKRTAIFAWLHQKEKNIEVIKTTRLLCVARNFLSAEDFVYFPKVFSSLALVVAFIKNTTQCELEVRV